MGCPKDLALNVATRSAGTVLTYTSWEDFLTDVGSWDDHGLIETGCSLYAEEGDKVELSTLKERLKRIIAKCELWDLDEDEWANGSTEKDWDGCTDYDIAFYDQNQEIAAILYAVPLVALPGHTSGDGKKFHLMGERDIDGFDDGEFDIVLFKTIEFTSDKSSDLTCSVTKSGGSAVWYRASTDSTYENDDVSGASWDPGGSEETFELRIARPETVTQISWIAQDITSALDDLIKELGDFRKLTHLYMQSNSITGSIPAEIQNLVSLVQFKCSGNGSLGGSIPPEIGKLTLVSNFEASSCNLSGAIPDELGNCTLLENITLWDNNLSGEIPAILAGLTSLYYLNLKINAFSSYASGAFESLIVMTKCDLYNNAITSATDINEIFADLVINEAAGSPTRNCIVDLSGGTNAAPTGQGITDKNALIAAGWTVTTN